MTWLGADELDLLVVGSGVAGLSAAVRAADELALRVGVLTKGELAQAATRWAQGGVAAVLGGDPDSTDLHLADTLAAGAGLCDVDAVRVLVDEGPGRVNELIAMGARFDRDREGRLLLAREGGHSLARIVHAGGAATGAEIERALVDEVRATAAACWERWFALELLVDGGRCGGVRGDRRRTGRSARSGPGTSCSRPAARARSSRPPPTRSSPPATAWPWPCGPAWPAPTSSSCSSTRPRCSARGCLGRCCRRRCAGTARSSATSTASGSSTSCSPATSSPGPSPPSCSSRTPTTCSSTPPAWSTSTSASPPSPPTCAAPGSTPPRDFLPIAPAAHYQCGGVVTDLDGASTLPGLWAAGEVACTGVHGANRLACNSLLEGMVFGPRVIEAIGRGVDGPSRRVRCGPSPVAGPAAT